MKLVELRQVSRTYVLGQTRVRALRDVDLTIAPGELLAVCGPSGSGKSTLCHMVGMLDTPSSGSVRFRGTDIAELDDDARAELRNRSVGYVFQDFNLVPVLTALENVMLPLQIRGMRAAAARPAAAAALARVGLETEAGRRPAALSGGQRQRVAVARALVLEPAIIVADEPTANLDTDTAHTIIALFEQLNAACGTAFLFATHDRRLLDGAQRRIQLRDGACVDTAAAAAAEH